MCISAAPPKCAEIFVLYFFFAFFVLYVLFCFLCSLCFVLISCLLMFTSPSLCPSVETLLVRWLLFVLFRAFISISSSIIFLHPLISYHRCDLYV